MTTRRKSLYTGIPVHTIPNEFAIAIKYLNKHKYIVKAFMQDEGLYYFIFKERKHINYKSKLDPKTNKRVNLKTYHRELDFINMFKTDSELINFYYNLCNNKPTKMI